MPDKKTELQVTLETLLDKKKGKHGNLFQIKINHYHYTPMWVSNQKISKEAVAAYLKTIKITNFVKKIIHFDTPSQKFSPAAGTLIVGSLSRGQVSDGRLHLFQCKNSGKNNKNYKFRIENHSF